MWTLQNVIVLGYSGPQIEQGLLSLNGVKAVEVEEDELGIPVTASYHVRIPLRHNAVFEVNIRAETQGTQVIMGNKHLLEKHLNMYQHEVAIFNRRKQWRDFRYWQSQT